MIILFHPLCLSPVSMCNGQLISFLLSDLSIHLCPSAGSMFFFSSIRRHTICYRDWSSDVCSSDLPTSLNLNPPVADALCRANEFNGAPRSEERRVGKECRSRWSTYHEKNKTTRRLQHDNTHQVVDESEDGQLLQHPD